MVIKTQFRSICWHCGAPFHYLAWDAGAQVGVALLGPYRPKNEESCECPENLGRHQVVFIPEMKELNLTAAATVEEAFSGAHSHQVEAQGERCDGKAPKASTSIIMADLRHNSTASSIDFLAFVGVAWMFACRNKDPHQSTRKHRAWSRSARFRPV